VARILIGWELGAGRGHIVPILAITRRLVTQGHSVTLALQELSAAGSALPPGVTLLQAPVWPGLLTVTTPRPYAPIATIFDILARLGLASPGCLTSLVRAWDGLLAMVRPDAVIADHAPALLVAARGRVRSFNVGAGFQVPPSDGDHMQRLTTEEPGNDYADLLDTIDADLRAAGRESLSALPAFFAADHALIANFAELDPYTRTDPATHYIAPYVGEWSVPQDGLGEEIFVYVHHRPLHAVPLWQGLLASGARVRAFVPLAGNEVRAALAQLGVIVETRPVPWAVIAARSRIVVSHAGHGFPTAAMLAGLPQIVAPYDIEKDLRADALMRTGLSRTIDRQMLDDADAVAALTAEALADDDQVVRARSAAPGFAARMTPSFEESVCAAVTS